MSERAEKPGDPGTAKDGRIVLESARTDPNGAIAHVARGAGGPNTDAVLLDVHEGQ
jgi:hypothetical protein